MSEAIRSAFEGKFTPAGEIVDDRITSELMFIEGDSDTEADPASVVLNKRPILGQPVVPGARLRHRVPDAPGDCRLDRQLE